MKEYINQVLGNSLRCILPSYWWKRLLGMMADRIERAETNAANYASRLAVYVDNSLADKQDKLVSGQNIKTINGQNILGGGDITIEGGSGGNIDTSNLATKEELEGKVDKVDGKQLSTEDFTTALKSKLEELKNYDDAALVSRIDAIQETIDTLFSKDASSAIESFNEIIAFLEGIEDSENLDSIIASIEQQIADVQSSIPAQLDILKAVYPVGAIYISTASTSPKTLFGFGTWTRIKDTFLLSAGDTYSAGDTGGEAEHTLTTDEMPSHKHTVTTAEAGEHTHTIGNDEDVAYNSSGRCRSVHKAATGASYYDGATGESGTHTHTMTVKNTGGGNAHNNMPPYLAVYMWQRTA